MIKYAIFVGCIRGHFLLTRIPNEIARMRMVRISFEVNASQGKTIRRCLDLFILSRVFFCVRFFFGLTGVATSRRRCGRHSPYYRSHNSALFHFEMHT